MSATLQERALIRATDRTIVRNGGKTERLLALAIVEKSPGDLRRVGPVEEQDWWRQVREAAVYHRVKPNSEIWCTSATKLNGSRPAVAYYEDAAQKMGVPIIVGRMGYETVTQLETYALGALERKADLVLFVTASHLKRVQWICKWKKIRANFVVCKGKPNPHEARTDRIMEIAYPIMQKLHILNWFLRRVAKRRKEGKL